MNLFYLIFCAFIFLQVSVTAQTLYSDYVKSIEDKINRSSGNTMLSLLNEYSLKTAFYDANKAEKLNRRVLSEAKFGSDIYVFARIVEILIKRVKKDKENFFNKLTWFEKDKVSINSIEAKSLYYFLKAETRGSELGQNLNEYYLRKCDSLLGRLNNNFVKGIIYLGIIYNYNRAGKLTEAKKYLDIAEGIITNDSDSRNIALLNLEFGYYYYANGQLEVALGYYLKNTKYENIFDYKDLISLSYYQIGNIHFAIWNTKEALKNYDEAIKLYSLENNFQGLSSCYASKANLFARAKDFENARLNSDLAAGIVPKIKDPNTISNIYNSLGKVYHYLEDWKEAVIFGEKALEYAKKADLTYNIGYMHYQLGIYYSHLGNYSKSTSNFGASKSIAEQLNSMDFLRYIYLEMHNSYIRLKDTTNAYIYFKYYTALKDSIDEIERTKKIDELQLVFETEKKEKEIQLLKEAQRTETILRFALIAVVALILIILAGLYNKYHYKKRSEEKIKLINNELEKQHLLLLKQSEEIKRINNELQTQINMKDRLFSIIAHDLRNPFTVLMSISDLIISNYNSIDDGEKQFLLSQMLKSSKSTFGLLENLLNWALTKRKELSLLSNEIDLNSIIDEIEDHFAPELSAKKIKINREIKINNFTYDKNSLQIILRNLIANAIKFSFENSAITVLSNLNNGKFHISVSDTGVGILSENLTKLFDPNSFFSTKGTKKEKGTGLGLVLCKEIAIINKSEIIVKSIQGKGSTFTLII